MATATTNPTARKRTPAKKAAPAAKPETAAVETDAEATDAAGTTVITFPLERLDDTKNYAVFQPDPSTGCVGKLYVPLGTESVKVRLSGPAS